MPVEEVVSQPAPEADQSEINLSDYRKARTEGKEIETPATPEEAVKTAPVTEAGKAEQEEEEVEGTDKDGKPTRVKIKGGFQRKIDKLTRENGEKDRAISDLTSRLQALEQKKPEVQQTSKTEGDPEPQEKDFTDYKEFTKALSRWVSRQELKADKEAAAKTQQEQADNDRKAQTKQVLDKYVDGMRAVKTSKPDFDVVFSDVQFPDYIHNRMVRMENGPTVAYELAKNKEVLKKIIDLNAEALRRGDNDFSEAYWEFGAFVRSLNGSSPAPKTEKPVSQAPAPITPVGGAAGPTEIDLDKGDISIAEYRRQRAAGKIR